MVVDAALKWQKALPAVQGLLGYHSSGPEPAEGRRAA
jgi:hypothetical protein